MAPLVLLVLVSTARAAAWTACEPLERHGRVHRQGRAADLPWEQIRAAFLDYLSERPANPAAARAARYLARSSVTLDAAPIELAVGAAAAAEYEPAARRVSFDEPDVEPLRRAWPSPRRRRRALAAFVERQSPVLVHELLHARLRDELGALPPFSEEELLADAEEALFLWGRLGEDPAALGLRRFEALMEEPVGARWWQRPLDDDDEAFDARLERAQRRVDDSWLAERWRLVRGMGGGYDAFAESLRRAGVVEGASLLSLDEAARLRALAQTRRLREAHARCLTQADADDRADLAGWVERLDAETVAYEDPTRLRAMRERFSDLMAGQRRELVSLRGR